jgi:predicted site-specific integrase-resolvase
VADDWWTKEQACEHLGITMRTLNRYIADGVRTYRPDVRTSTRYVRREEVQAKYRDRRIGQKQGRATRRDPRE